MAEATHILKIIIRVTDKAMVPMKQVENQMNKVNQAMQRNNKELLGIGLGMTFFLFGVNMQIQRVLRSMFNVFQQAEGETGAMNQQFNIVKANLAAISIAFFDAFAQSAVFEFIVSAVSKIADWFLNLSDNTRAWIAGTLIGLSAIIMVISIGGQFVLAIYAFMEIWKALFGAKGDMVKTMAEGMGDVGKKDSVVGKFDNGWGIMKKLIGAGLLIKASVDTYKSITDSEPTPFMDILKTVMMAAAGGFLVWGVGGALAAGIISLVVLLETNQLKIKMKEVNDAMKKKVFAPQLLTDDEMSSSGAWWTGTQVPEAAKRETERLKNINNPDYIDFDALTQAIREGAKQGTAEGYKMIPPPVFNIPNYYGAPPSSPTS